ncbi:MAG: hypothetical protein HOW73_04915 [Polyangiaceae bacterium]|nr:hypothetical protein [Polyangiaceae bacterium]
MRDGSASDADPRTDGVLPKVTTNTWKRDDRGAFEVARVLDHRTAPEGLDVDRIRFLEAGDIAPDVSLGHVVTVLAGASTVAVESEPRPLTAGQGTHFYLPRGSRARFTCTPGTELIRVSAGAPSQARGTKLLVRDETFVAACAAGDHALRWILTPQYLSRRIFLHHDEALLSKRLEPVSWFHTTMFDVAGLPTNESGESVFKMAYSSRTEINVCYDVAGDARVRTAIHPYTPREQAWSPWLALTGNANYHINETVDGQPLGAATSDHPCRRNKHEVLIQDGHVSLLCLFDPSPTGVERHRPGEYSDYEPLASVVTRPEYAAHRREIVHFDEMVDTLSLAKARGQLELVRQSPAWELYLKGREAQRTIEARLLAALRAEGGGRDRVVERWSSAT